MSDLSALEQRRLANISRNEAFLSELGLDASRRSQVKRVKKKVNHSSVKILFGSTRKSLRIANIVVAVDYNNDVLLDDVDDIVDDGDEKKAKRAKRNDALISKSYPAAAALAREINATLEFYLSSGLGCKQNEYGKAAAGANNGVIPRFSKYSGVVEWKNCCFLWVNVGFDRSVYPNTFSKAGDTMTWYGGSKMSGDSSVIQRLLKVGKKSNSSDQVILFVREEGDAYCCLGRLHVMSHKLDVHPVELVWQLVDYELIKESKDFRSVLEVARVR